MYLNIYAYSIRSLSCDVHHLYNHPFSFSPIFNNLYTIYLFVFFILLLFLFLITRTLKPDGLAKEFSTTSLPHFEYNLTSVLVKIDPSLSAEIPKYFNFV